MIKGILWVIFSCVALLFAIAILGGICTPKPKKGGAKTTAAATPPEDSIPVVPDAETRRAREAAYRQEHNWSYDTSEDPMNSRKEYIATVIANEKVSLPSTQEQEVVVTSATNTATRNRYSSRKEEESQNTSFFNRNRQRTKTTTTTTQRTRTRSVSHFAVVSLALRKRSDGGTDMYLHASEGAFAQEHIDGRMLARVRFDKNPPSNYVTAGAMEGDPSYLFLRNIKPFIRQLKKAKTLLIEVGFSHSGMQVLEFDVHQLQWNH
ncbi:hypothetical protein [Chitinophaga nivalis]|uniref:Uncharacterized protein n=1 Tax=Chitinophaga nivalis TaxID=2991709 RepID=A0ABT3IQY0_9BACT|nr:hypothetical protein [Chitinophaga nivalis]MCW3463957.1 hypothetical protein [Chitinophaga nivalis]MCW3486353.1 hypothetical protein [Chitinophaga nivalis]